MSRACAGETIPGSVRKKFVQATSLIGQAATSSRKRAAKLLKRAKAVLKSAKAKAGGAAKGRKARISSDCAAVLRHAADEGVAGLASLPAPARLRAPAAGHEARTADP